MIDYSDSSDRIKVICDSNSDWNWIWIVILDVNNRENIVRYLWLDHGSYLKFVNVTKYSDSE